MLRFVLDVLLLRDLVRSRAARAVLLVFFLCVLVAGVIYVGVILQALSERNNTPHVHTRSSH